MNLDENRQSRRRYLALIGLSATGALAGCSEEGGEDDGTEDPSEGSEDDSDDSSEDTGDANENDGEDDNDEDESDLDPASFEIDLASLPTVETSDTIDLDGTIENTGEQQATQELTVTIDGDTATTESTTLDSGESSPIEPSITIPDSSGEYDVTVSTDDDEETVTLTVEQPPAFFEVSVNSSPTVQIQEDVDLDVDIENTGERQGTQDIIVNLDGDTVATESVKVDAGDRSSTSLTFSAPEDTGEYYVTAASDDDEDTETLTVEEPIDRIIEPDGTVPAGEDIELVVETSLDQGTAINIIFRTASGVDPPFFEQKVSEVNEDGVVTTTLDGDITGDNDGDGARILVSDASSGEEIDHITFEIT